MTARRIGDWTQTYTGRQFWPLDPRPSEVSIIDIAHALSNQCRFSGHSNTFYSVAQHSVIVSRLCPKTMALTGLMHDASEAYLGDWIRPIKKLMLFNHCGGLVGASAIEDLVWQAICDRFGLIRKLPEDIIRCDDVALVTEARDIMGGQCRPWPSNAEPLPQRIVPVGPKDAEIAFLTRFIELTDLESAP